MPPQDYKAITQRFLFTGIQLQPQDVLDHGKTGFARNVRAYEDGTFQPRDGLLQVTPGAIVAGAVHSIWRLNDVTIGAIAAQRFVGIGANIYNALPTVGAVYTLRDSGYSGNPLTTVNLTPPNSPQPWTYIGDSTRARKINNNNLVRFHGIAPPSAPANEPTTQLTQPIRGIISDFENAPSWAAATPITGVSSLQSRVNTTIDVVRYDVGTNGYGSFSTNSSLLNITPGVILTVAGAETAIVTDVIPAIATTTIASILYDAGTTGACTIQPVGSLGMGQLEGPTLADYRSRVLGQSQANRAPNVTNQGAASVTPVDSHDPKQMRTRNVDFPVNAIVVIAGTEAVRITSAVVGPDGVQSFRCVTTSNYVAGQSLTGRACFRAFTLATRAPGDTLVTNCVQTVITPLTTEPAVGGIVQNGLTVNLAQINNRAVQAEDYFQVQIHADFLSAVNEVRIYLDVNSAGANYTDNYYLATFRANDIITAIQSTNAAVPATPLQDARQDAVLQAQIDQPIFTRSGAIAPGTGNRAARDPVSGLWYDTGVRAFGQVAPPGQRNAAPTTPAETRGQFASTAPVVAVSATSSQLALGNNQWIPLKCRIRDLVRVGTDTSRTLANVRGVEILMTVSGQITPITVQFDAAWVIGTYGPDVGETGAPYVWCYRYRSTTTGAVSNPSPPTRHSEVPRRQRVELRATQSPDPQVDIVDFFRFGGSLANWSYDGSAFNSSSPFLHVDNDDSSIDGNAALQFDRFQPWPIADRPRTGTCVVAGTTIRRTTSGDAFNTAWPPGTLITVNGTVSTLWASPVDTDTLYVTTNLGSSSSATWTVANPVLMNQRLPALWGGSVNDVVFLFACGDPSDPGVLHWTFGNDPETTSDANWLGITSADEPLLNGFVSDGQCFVFSSDDLYRVVPTFGQISTFQAQDTPCGRGLWTPWAFTLTPDGVVFLAKDGIYLSAWGAPAVSITDDDLYRLFPHDGTTGRTVNGIPPPNMASPGGLRLCYVDGLIYFEYDAVGTGRRTLIYQLSTKAWMFDQYEAESIAVRAWEQGQGVHDQILGGLNGNLYQYDTTALTDNGVAINWNLWTPWVDGGDPRINKQFGDVLVNAVCNSPSSLTPVMTVAPVYNNATGALPVVTLGAGLGSGQANLLIEINAGDGLIAQNLGLQLSGSVTASYTARPKLYWWQPTYLVKAANIQRRALDWDDAGTPGAKFVQGVIIRANTYGVAKTVQVQYDGGTIAQTLTITHTGESEIAYPLAAAGWTPFIAHLVRLVGADAIDWQFLDATWIFEPAPELATQWETQPTSHDLPGFVSIRDLVVAYQSTTAVTLTLVYDGGATQTYTLPSTAGVYRRTYLPLATGKGRAVTYRWTSTAPFRLFKRDLSCRVQGWGLQGYIQTTPFGGPSRADGAAI